MATWDEVIPDFLLSIKGNNAAPNTIRFYQMYLIGLTRWAEENQVTLEEFDRRAFRRYLSYRADYIQPMNGKKLAESTRRHDVVVARRLTKFALEEGWLKVDVLKDYKLPKAQKTAVRMPTIEDIAALLTSITRRWDVRHNPKARFMPAGDRTFLRLRDHAIICTIVEAGLRMSEVFALEFTDMHLAGPKPWIMVRERKGNEPTEIPVTRAYVDAVASWTAHRQNIHSKLKERAERAAAKGEPAPVITDKYFCSTVQSPVDYGVFRRTFVGYLRYGGLEHFTRHGIRHLFCTLQANKNVLSAMAMMGHKELKTTQGYCHEQKEQIRKDQAAASPLAELLSNRKPEAKKRGKKVVA